jgi:hypothetical protein
MNRRSLSTANPLNIEKAKIKNDEYKAWETNPSISLDVDENDFIDIVNKKTTMEN